MDFQLLNFVGGVVVGFIVAAIIGRGKFLAVQNQLRAVKEEAEEKIAALSVKRRTKKIS